MKQREQQAGDLTKFILKILMGIALLLQPAMSAAQGQLETPQPGSFQSGIGLVRGWVCQATRVDIEVTGRGTLPAVYGETRSDTQARCGDVNNGFSLQMNWNELGEGTHTVRALADGVELGRAQVVVATFGEPYLRGVQGNFIIEPFPQSGKQTRLHWEESRQLFVLSNDSPASGGGNSPRTDAKLEDPQPGSFQSGIGLIRGWVCNVGRIDIDIDERFSLPAVYGEPRSDTQTVCGDTNNGFSLLVNWNDIGDGTHTVRALADGVELGSATFTVVTLGLGSFPRGLVGDFVLNNFPQPSFQTEVRWQESQQNFVIAGARFPGQSPALCTTRNGEASDRNGGDATITWTNPCLLSGNVALLRIQVPNTASLSDEDGNREEHPATDGAFPLCATDLRVEQEPFSFGSEIFRLTDLTGKVICRELPRGSTLEALLQVNEQSHLNFNNPFIVTYRGSVALDFFSAVPAGKPTLAVSVPDLIFDAATTATPQEKSFTITNTGGGTLEGGMTLVASGPGGNQFSLTPATINVGAGQSQTVMVRFSPVLTDAVTASLRIATNGGARSIVLRGQSQSGQAQLAVSQTTLDFGSVEIPGTVDRTLTVTNNGAGVLNGRINIQFGNFSVVSGGTFSLAANQSQTVTIRFTSFTRGKYTGDATVSSNGGFVTIPLNGTAIGPELSVTGLKELFPGTPLSDLKGLDFGCGGTESFTVENVGEGTLSGAVSTSPPFQVTKGASFRLPAGKKQKVSIKLKKLKKGQITSGGAQVESNGGSQGVSMFASCLKFDPFD